MPEFQQKPEILASLAAVPFRNRELAGANFASVQRRMPPGLAALVPPLLADLPDPDAALNFLERWTDSANEGLVQQLEQHRSFLHYALTVFGYSQFLGETLLKSPDVIQAFQREHNLDRSHSHEDFREGFARFRSRSFEDDISLLLARFKRRQYIRIMVRDVLGIATLAETTAEISSLSDVLIDEALRESVSALHRRYGSPQHRDFENRLVDTPFAVLALGKLGGNELNYSSDVDLLYIYGEGEADDDALITNREYFVRLGQQVTDVLSRVTPEGSVFRIDLRLRPQGREGETAISLGHALRYYSESAQDWERQALIKARVVAGDEKLGRQFIRAMQPHIYTEQVNFAAMDTALQALQRIRDRRLCARDGSIDAKLDRGGIRDIEFLVQCLQRVYGGKERWLRGGGTLFSLQKLHDMRHISGSEFHHLTTAYEFLRCIEHRLQLRRGQQTHRIPADDHELAVLARSLSRSSAEALPPEQLVDTVRERMANVSNIYDRIVHQQQQRTEQHVSETFELHSDEVEFGRVPSDRQVLQRLRADSPALYEIAARSDLEPHTRRNLFKFLSSAFTSAERYAAVASSPAAVDRALELFRTSEFLTDILVRHPEDVASLHQLRQFSNRHQDEVLFSTDDMVRGGHSEGLEDYLASDALPHSERMALLRRRFRYRIFLSGARDIIEARPVFASFADTTSAAEEAISVAWAIAGRPDGLAILALGRLGTFDFDCLSDVDLLFVRDKGLDARTAARACEEVVHSLSAYTNEGSVVPVDLRLRPRGNEGEIVITTDELESYFQSEALAWEALTHTKVRFIAGTKAVAAQTIAAAEELRRRFAGDSSFSAEVNAMRNKLEKSEPGLKTSPGGSYDIDFLVSYLIVQHRVHIAHGTVSERLRTLARAGSIPNRDLQVLLDALELFRTVDHSIRLVTGGPAKSLPVAEGPLSSVSDLSARIMSRQFSGTLEQELKETRDRVRNIFDRLLR